MLLKGRRTLSAHSTKGNVADLVTPSFHKTVVMEGSDSAILGWSAVAPGLAVAEKWV
jgi:hypothetical protein